jgi:hypothetical protein
MKVIVKITMSSLLIKLNANYDTEPENLLFKFGKIKFDPIHCSILTCAEMVPKCSHSLSDITSRRIECSRKQQSSSCAVLCLSMITAAKLVILILISQPQQSIAMWSVR